MVLELRVEQPNGVFNKAKRGWRRLLVGPMPHKQLLEPARMKAHQQVDRASRDVRKTVASSRRHADEITWSQVKDLLVQQESEMTRSNEKRLLNVVVPVSAAGGVSVGRGTVSHHVLHQ